MSFVLLRSDLNSGEHRHLRSEAKDRPACFAAKQGRAYRDATLLQLGAGSKTKGCLTRVKQPESAWVSALPGLEPRRALVHDDTRPRRRTT
jgi:hypothetical protein